jgi:hypothetical protein
MDWRRKRAVLSSYPRFLRLFLPGVAFRRLGQMQNTRQTMPESKK